MSPILREEHWLRVFENRVLRKIFGYKREGIRAGWKKKCRSSWSIPLTKFYSGYQIKKNAMGGACGRYWREKILGFDSKRRKRDIGVDGRVILK